jgi:voltage-gated potassium channel Kch
MPDLFVSYSPSDAAFVADLTRELSRRNLDVFVHWDDGEDSTPDSLEPSSPDPEVRKAIAESQAVLFLLRPESLSSETCKAELELAFAHKKRVIPILREDLGRIVAPDRLMSVRWIPAMAEHKFTDVVKRLLHALHRDLARVRSGTSLRMRRRHWREEFKPRWNAAREPMLAAAALAALILGTIGYLQAVPAKGQHYSLMESLYRALTLYGFGGAVSFKAPLTLQIARVLAPLALGFAAVRGIFHLFADELQVLRIRLFVRNHVVVVGLGQAGYHAVKSFYEDGWAVVAIERDGARSEVVAARDLGVPVLIADGRDKSALRRARLGRARYLLIIGDDDGVNFDVAMGAADHVAERKRGALTAFVHIEDLRLWRELKARAVAAINDPGFRLDVFNIHFTAAHMMVDRFAPFEDAEGNELDDPHVCIVGLDGVAEGLVRRIASTWHQRHPDRQLRLTIAGPSADVGLQALVLRCPALEQICELSARPLDTNSAEFALGGVLLDGEGNCDVTKAYVALDSQGESLAAAFGLHGSTSTACVPVVVTLDDAASGTARAIQGVEGRAFAHEVKPFGVLSSALTAAIVLEGTTELIARARHDDYVRAHLAAGKPSDRTVPWDQLPEEYKDESRCFAAWIGEGLSCAGCAVAPDPLIDTSTARFAFTDAEVEEIAKRQHSRWCEEKERDGWRWDDAENPAKRTHPNLVAWEKLKEPVKVADREAIRDLPGLLAGVGLEIYRLQAAANGHGVSPPSRPILSAPGAAASSNERGPARQHA